MNTQTLPLYHIRMTQSCQRAITLALAVLDNLTAGHGAKGAAKANAAAESVRRELHTVWVGDYGPVPAEFDQAERALALYQAAMMFVFGGKSVGDAIERTGAGRALSEARAALPDVGAVHPAECPVPGTTRVYTSVGLDQQRRYWVGDPEAHLDFADLNSLTPEELRAVAAFKESLQ